MPTKYFTPEEANAALAEIEPLMAEVLEKRAKVVRDYQEIRDVVENTPSDFGGVAFSRMTRDFSEIRTLIDDIQTFGCIIKDLNVGLLDFPARIDGRDVFLCWRYGESRVEHYHELHTGFSGRQQV